MSSIVIAGDTSGSVTLQAPAVAGSTVITLPSTSTTLVSSQWTTSGSNIFYNTGSVGVGAAPDSTFYVGGGALGTVRFFYNGTSINYNDVDTQIWRTAGASELARLTSTGLGIGTSSPSYKLQVSGTSNTVGLGITGTSASGDNGIYYNVPAITGSYNIINAVPSASTGANVTFGNGNSASGNAFTRLDLLTTGASGGDPKLTYTVSGVLNWCVGVDNSDSDRFKISGSDAPGTNDYLIIDTSGSVLVGTTGLDGRFRVQESGLVWARVTNHGYAGTQFFDSFRYNGTEIGKITGNNSNVSFVTSSDYRLKENIAPMVNALAKVAQLKPCTYNWKLDGAEGQGFIAHELQAVVPDAVVGEKDAVDEDGKIKPQGIDTSFLVATLTAAIQEQQALITTLTERITALEGV